MQTLGLSAFRRKKALQDSQEIASKLHPSALSPHTAHSLSPLEATEFAMVVFFCCFILPPPGGRESPEPNPFLVESDWPLNIWYKTVYMIDD